MDEDAELPEARAPADRGVERSPDPERVVERLTELREELEMVASEDPDRWGQAGERVRQAQERIETLEEMLARARDREDDLTTRAVRDRIAIGELEGTIVGLSAVAAKVSEMEAARAAAETEAGESRSLLRLAQAELEAERGTVRRLTSRCAELEADIGALAEEVADAALARTEAARLEQERNIARERARTERRLALEDRLRATDAE